MFHSPSNVHSLSSTTGGLTETLSTQNTARIFWHWKGASVLLIFSNFNKLFHFQTTVGRLLCEKATKMNTFSQIFYIILARDSDGSQLKKSFEEEFQSQNAKVKIKIVNRMECIKIFKLKDTDDEVELVHSILRSVPASSFVFIDEANMLNNYIYIRKETLLRLQRFYDWSSLRNTREDTFLVLSFKPVVVELKDRAESVEPKFPREAEVVTLTRSYRQSFTLFNSLQKYQMESERVRVLKAEVNPVNIVRGLKPCVINYDGDLTDDMEIFILHKLKDYRPQDVKILFSKKKSKDAQEIFGNSRFSDCLTKETSFIGCEAPVVVMFFSDADRNFQFMEMASRAQSKVGP